MSSLVCVVRGKRVLAITGGQREAHGEGAMAGSLTTYMTPP
jgi:hypothetical protein